MVIGFFFYDNILYAGMQLTIPGGALMTEDGKAVDVQTDSYINTYLGGNVGAEYANPAGQGRITIK